MGAPKAAKAKKPTKKADHPPSAVMIAAAIAALKDKKGSSRQAIKKYVAANYKVDIVKIGPFLNKALRAGVVKKSLVAVKGSYKLAKVEKPKKKKVVKKKAVKKSPKKKAKTAKKAKSPKKAAKTAKKAKTPKKAKTAKKAAKPAKKASKPAAKKAAAKKSPKKAKAAH